MNWEELRERLREEFDADDEVVDAVVEQTKKLVQSGDFEEISDQELTVDFLVEKLLMAQRPLTDSWNWYLGSLDFINANFRKYQIK